MELCPTMFCCGGVTCSPLFLSSGPLSRQTSRICSEFCKNDGLLIASLNQNQLLIDPRNLWCSYFASECRDCPKTLDQKCRWVTHLADLPLLGHNESRPCCLTIIVTSLERVQNKALESNKY